MNEKRRTFILGLAGGVMSTLAIRQLAVQTKSNMDSVLLECDSIDNAVPQGSLPAIITFPTPNRVFQKASGTNVTATFKPTWRGNADTIVLKSGATVVASATISQEITAPPGWYDLVLVTAGVEGDSIKVGIGDVYVVAGQSNGVSPRQPATYFPATPPAGRVIVSDYYYGGRDSFIDCGVQPLIRSPDGALCWLFCGIALNRSYPVMFVVQSQGSTSTTQWVNEFVIRIFEAWAKYKPKAILWHQGESDALGGFTQATSFYNMDAMVLSLRQVTVTPWIVAKNSINGGYAPIRAAQQQIIDKWPHVYPGPDTDTIRNPSVNADSEFFGTQLEQHGNAWASYIIANGL